MTTPAAARPRSAEVSGRHPLGWISPFAVGISCAVAAEVAIGLLLYAGPGFVRSLTILLTVEAAALAAGLWLPYPAREPVDGLRRRWLSAMMAFLAATVFGTLWTLRPDIGSGSVGQGIGLAVLAGLPLYTCGALLTGLAQEAQETDARRKPRVAAPGAFGAAVGFALTGLLLPRAPTPSSLLVGCLVLLSMGGMAYGVVRAARGRKRIVAQGCIGPPPVRIEEHVRAGGDRAEWVLLEGDVVRAVRSSNETVEADAGRGASRDEGSGGDGRRGGADGGPATVAPWDVDLVLAFGPSEPSGWRTLHLGGGASMAPGMVLRLDPSAEVTVLERAHCVVELGRSYFGTEPGSRVRMLTGNMEDHLRSLEGDFDLIVVDGRALDAVGGMSALSMDGRRVLHGLLGPEGIVAWGPKAAHHPMSFDDPEWETYRRDPSGTLDEVMIVRRVARPSPSVARLDGGTTIP